MILASSVSAGLSCARAVPAIAVTAISRQWTMWSFVRMGSPIRSVVRKQNAPRAGIAHDELEAGARGACARSRTFAARKRLGGGREIQRDFAMERRARIE